MLWINGLILLFVQAEVEGQMITWLTPHSLQQVVSDDVDIVTMLNFLQLYEVSYIFLFTYFFFSAMLSALSSMLTGLKVCIFNHVMFNLVKF